MPRESHPTAVRDHRVAAGITQADLAHACGTSRQTIVSIEGGQYSPSVWLALRIARALHAELEALFPLPTIEEAP
ncbi:helix-turn-helix transcriptional regulator [Lolliginicoccus levis]|uniref:helix-turn-helix transcriptional regulator n=1 Tax=Lolliginicoccus levis TaxID=2919542 RepID=UPI002420006B|nr:helix-turn-helix transcriptional regulator [Lolliginicoccus levis]